MYFFDGKPLFCFNLKLIDCEMRESNNSKRKKTDTLTIATKVARRKVICDVANQKNAW